MEFHCIITDNYSTTRIMPIFIAGNNFLGVIGTSLAMLGYSKLLSQTSKVVTYYSSVV